MKSQHISLLSGVVDAISDLADAGDEVGVTVQSVTTTFPDGSTVIFTADRSTSETDWHILMASAPPPIPPAVA